MKNKYKLLLNNTAIFAIGNFGSKIVLFLLVPLYTQFLSASEYGTAEFIETAASFIMPFLSVVIYDAILRFVLTKEESSEAVLWCASAVFLVGSLAMVSITPLLGLYSIIGPWKWYLCAYVISYMAFQIVMVYIRAVGKSMLFATLSVSYVILLAILNVIYLCCFRKSVDGYLSANIVAHGIMALIGIFAGKINRDFVRGHLDTKLLWRMLKYSSPLILNNVSWWVLQSSDKIMIEYFMGAAALGLYGIAAKIPAIINTVISVFSQAWGVSSISEYCSDKDDSFFAGVFRIYTFLTALMCSGVMLITPLLLKFYVSNEFYLAWKAVPLLLLSAGFSAIAVYFAWIYASAGRSANVMLSTVISAGINIMLNFAMTPRFGIIGAAAATALSYAFAAVFRLFDSRRFFKFKINFKVLASEYMLLLLQAVCVTLDWNKYAISLLILCAIALLNMRDIILPSKRYLLNHLSHRRRNS